MNDLFGLVSGPRWSSRSPRIDRPARLKVSWSQIKISNVHYCNLHFWSGLLSIFFIHAKARPLTACGRPISYAALTREIS